MRGLAVDARIGWLNLLQHRKRTLFLGGAIAGVTCLLILLSALTDGIRDTMQTTATTLITGHLNVGGFYKVTAGQSAPVVTEYRRILDIVRTDLPEVDYAVGRGRGWARLSSETGGMQVGIAGFDLASEPRFREVVRAVSGSLDDLEKPGTILIFENQAKKLDVKVGDTVTFAAPLPNGTFNTLDVRVAAIGRNMGLMSSWQVFLPSQSLRALYRLNENATGAVHLYLKDTSLSARVAAKARDVLTKRGFRVMDQDPNPFWMKFEKVNREDWTGQKLDVTSWEDELSFFTWILGTLGALRALLIGILLAIIVVGIMNTMWIAIRERTREIGSLRAIGMHRRRVLAMFLIEAFLLGVLGTVTGAALGVALAAALNAASVPLPLSAQFFLMSDTLRLLVGPGLVASSVLSITAVTTLAALYPSLRAARLKPVTAMHHAG